MKSWSGKSRAGDILIEMSTLFRRLSLFVIVIACALGVGGMWQAMTSRPDVISPRKIEEVTPVPEPVRSTWAEGIERVTYAYSTTTRGVIDLFGFDQATYRASMRTTSSAFITDKWMQTDGSIVALVNGAYFLEDFSPAGFLVINGKGNRERAFDWHRTGLMVFGEQMTIRETTTVPSDIATLKDAAQSYPFLIKDGKPAVSEDSGLRARRSFIGTDTDGRVWIGILWDDALSLYELSQRLAELPIQWTQAMNLDGGPSSGLFVRAPGERRLREDVAYTSFVGVPNVVVIEKR